MKPKIVQITAIDASMNNLLGLLNKKSQDNGYEIHCICSPGDGANKILENGYTFHPIKIERRISLFSNLKSIYKIYKVLKRIRPDIVHVHTPIAAVLGRITAKLAGVKTTIYTAHGFYFHEGMSKKEYNLFFNIEKLMGKFFTDYLFTQSKEDYEVAKSHKFLRNESNYLHISNGIDVDGRFNVEEHGLYSEGIRKKLNIQDSDLLISFAGRLVKEKGILDLFEVFNYFKSYKDIKFIVLGEVAETERDQSIKKYIQVIQNRMDNVIFTGNVSNIEEFLFSSDIFILPSYREGMPRSIIEAMAMENAIIATNVRGSREEVDSDINGFLVNVNDPNSIINKVKKLYNDRDLLEKMKKSASKKAKNEYDEETVVLKQLNIFSEIIQQ